MHRIGKKEFAVARRLREQGTYCEIVPFQSADAWLRKQRPAAIILSGSPASTTEADSPRAPQQVFEAGIPVLGICYGEQTMCAQLGGKVEEGHHREFGRATLEITEASDLFEGFWSKGSKDDVWMSHGDKITAIPKGFKVIAVSQNAPYAAIADEVFSVLMGEDVESRKHFIQTNAQDVRFLDI